MVIDDIIELIEKNPSWNMFLYEVLDDFFPDEHEAYYMLSEGGESCCLESLRNSLGGNYPMPKEFDLLVDKYKKLNRH